MKEKKSKFLDLETGACVHGFGVKPMYCETFIVIQIYNRL